MNYEIIKSILFALFVVNASTFTVHPKPTTLAPALTISALLSETLAPTMNTTELPVYFINPKIVPLSLNKENSTEIRKIMPPPNPPVTDSDFSEMISTEGTSINHYFKREITPKPDFPVTDDPDFPVTEDFDPNSTEVIHRVSLYIPENSEETEEISEES